MTQQLTTDEQYLNTLLQKQRELSATSGDGGTNVSIALEESPAPGACRPGALAQHHHRFSAFADGRRRFGIPARLP